MMSAERKSCYTRRHYVIGLSSRVRVHVAVSDFSIDCRPQLSGRMRQKVRFGSKMSFNDADITWVEEENQVGMEVLEEGGLPVQ